MTIINGAVLLPIIVGAVLLIAQAITSSPRAGE